VKAQWAIWEWGASYGRLSALAKRRRRAAAAYDLENQKTADSRGSDFGNGPVDAGGQRNFRSEQTIASAEEAYRVTDAQTAAGPPPPPTLLEAQSALTQAAVNYCAPQYELATRA